MVAGESSGKGTLVADYVYYLEFGICCWELGALITNSKFLPMAIGTQKRCST